MAFETKEDAAERHATAMQQGKQKSPVGSFSNMEWDKEGLKAEVKSYEDGTLVNWSELARKYEVKNKAGELAKNGGQIAMEYLKSEAVDVERFRKKRGNNVDNGNIRKRLKRGAGGEITVPCSETNEKVKEQLKKKVLSGEINVGELIVPRKVICPHIVLIIGIRELI